MRRLLILGATSAIAQAVARRAAERGDALYLVGRSGERLGAIADDLRVRGAKAVHVETADLNDTDRHEALLDAAEKALGALDTLLVAHGTLTVQPDAERDFELFEREFRTNFLSAASILSRAANRFERRGSGTLAAISSVAGDRGRQSNYAYGTAKGALSLFLEGLRNRLAKKGVAVVTIKPGFVDTPMTAHLPKNKLYASPEAVGRRIYDALEHGEDVVYAPFFWRPIMAIIRAIPEPVFKRLKL